MRRIIGITGGIGSGKSVVSRLLRCRGFEVYDCDCRAKLLMEASAELKHMMCERFGEEALSGDGSINRRFVAQCVFGDDVHRLWLNDRVHGMVRDDLASVANYCSDNILFVESAIMKSSRLDEMCGEIWLVQAPVDLRVERVVRRDLCDADHVLRRIEAQKWEFEELAAPVREIVNDNVHPLSIRIDNLLKQI